MNSACYRHVNLQAPVLCYSAENAAMRSHVHGVLTTAACAPGQWLGLLEGAQSHIRLNMAVPIANPTTLCCKSLFLRLVPMPLLLPLDLATLSRCSIVLST